MRASSSFALASTLVALCNASPFDLERRGCGNNCARAVIASAFPNRPTKADCSSFVAVTVTPSTVTYTATVTDLETHTVFDVDTITQTDHKTQTNVQTATVTSTITTVLLNKRAVSTKAIPSYASACSSSAAYTDACSCIGVSAYTVTALAPSTTITIHATQTLSKTVSATETPLATNTETVSATVTEVVTQVVTSTPPPATETVKLSVLSPSSLAGDVIFNNQGYLQFSSSAAANELVVTPGGGPVLLGSDNTRVLYASNVNQRPGVLQFYTAANLVYVSSLTCSVNSDDTLACVSSDGRAVIAVCPNLAPYIYFGISLSSINAQFSTTCQAVTIKVTKV